MKKLPSHQAFLACAKHVKETIMYIWCRVESPCCMFPWAMLACNTQTSEFKTFKREHEILVLYMCRTNQLQ